MPTQGVDRGRFVPCIWGCLSGVDFNVCILGQQFPCSCRRKLLQANGVNVVSSVNSNNPSGTAAAYNAAVANGSLNQQLAPLGLQIGGSSPAAV